MPQFGLGVFQTPPETTAEIVRQAVALGYRAVDTASMYRNEEGVGEALDGRADVFVTTKLGNGDHGFDETLRAFEASAKRLGRAPDLYLIHWPRPRVDRYVDSWKAFVRLQREGGCARSASPTSTATTWSASSARPASPQRSTRSSFIPAFSSNPYARFMSSAGSRRNCGARSDAAPLLGDPVIVSIATKHGKTPAQVVIRWHLDSDLIVIPKSVHSDRLKENIGALDFRLDDDDMRRIRSSNLPDGRIGPDPATATF